MDFLLALLLTTIAGLGTTIGALLVTHVQYTQKKALSVGLGISAGAMCYISFVEILPKSADAFPQQGWLFAHIFLFLGILITAAIDLLIPSSPHEVVLREDRIFKRMGLLTAIAISLHNAPEGLVTFLAALENSSYGIPLLVAIMLHNIPEGLAIALPIYLATQSKTKALLWATASGLTEPLGAIVGYLILSPYITPFVQAALFSSVAGIMLYISIDELLPAAQRYAKPHFAVIGFMLGLLLMSLSIVYFRTTN